MKKLCLVLFHFLVCFQPLLMAEIQQMILRWNPLACEPDCARMLGQSLENMSGAEKVVVNPAAGQATIQWKQNVPFSFVAMNTAVRSVGINVQEFWVKVRGRIRVIPAPYTGDQQVTLISEGDQTPFILIGPIQPQPGTGRYTIPYSLETHRLSPSMEQQFIAAKNQNELVTVQGPLFEPARYMTTMYLMVDSAQVEKKAPANSRPLP